MVAWMQAGALFPFFRNHSSLFNRPQEPYRFSRRACAIICDCILTRAKVLPYIYNQFEAHWRAGESVMRPVSYEFSGSAYERRNDE